MVSAPVSRDRVVTGRRINDERGVYGGTRNHPSVEPATAENGTAIRLPPSRLDICRWRGRKSRSPSISTAERQVRPPVATVHRSDRPAWSLRHRRTLTGLRCVGKEMRTQDRPVTQRWGGELAVQRRRSSGENPARCPDQQHHDADHAEPR
jgi:hypothetical protein